MAQVGDINLCIADFILANYNLPVQIFALYDTQGKGELGKGIKLLLPSNQLRKLSLQK